MFLKMRRLKVCCGQLTFGNSILHSFAEVVWFTCLVTRPIACPNRRSHWGGLDVAVFPMLIAHIHLRSSWIHWGHFSLLLLMNMKLLIGYRPLSRQHLVWVWIQKNCGILCPDGGFSHFHFRLLSSELWDCIIWQLLVSILTEHTISLCRLENSSFFYSEDSCSNFLWNAANELPVYTSSQSRRQKFV